MGRGRLVVQLFTSMTHLGPRGKRAHNLFMLDSAKAVRNSDHAVLGHRARNPSRGLANALRAAVACAAARFKTPCATRFDRNGEAMSKAKHTETEAVPGYEYTWHDSISGW
jgi:hypothetical protein